MKMEWNKEVVDATLRKVRDQLLSGTIEPQQFDMNELLDVGSCGTVGCIAGHAMLIRARGIDPDVGTQSVIDLFDYTDGSIVSYSQTQDTALYDLFFNWGVDPTRARAARAIDNYLDGEKDPWAFSKS